MFINKNKSLFKMILEYINNLYIIIIFLLFKNTKVKENKNKIQ